MEVDTNAPRPTALGAPLVGPNYAGVPIGSPEYAYDFEVAGKRLRAWRLSQPRAAGLTMSELARRVGVGKSRIQHIETAYGARGPVCCTPWMRAKIADALGVKLGDIWPDAYELADDSQR
ncbi:helix-turn-helix domain-containing protein [Parafrankia sp. EUN1f]|uniref:helix-turn-helix domain-containing protein n=1 Tax=Parafrankia sp. EUN1f TaxID=102897 RepID=UPI0001C44A74|nr:helix-turn-helix transcriptional regulator [Parafrankia sp. EUN1f]EFC84491.1 transcriptional regulator, XRE family [Parafrankia sp. EUN1f]